MSSEIVVFWFRRDLRLHDNAGLYHALRNNSSVLPVFIFDTNILNDLPDKHDSRVGFIYQALRHVRDQVTKKGSTLYVLHDTPLNAFKKILASFKVKAVYTNHDYEPYARDRDKQVGELLQQQGVAFYTFKDQVIFDKSEVLKDNYEPYTVFTPYGRKWRERLTDFYLRSYPVEKYLGSLYRGTPFPFPSLAEIGFADTPLVNIPAALNAAIARSYDETRDYPAIEGTTRLGVHLRFGTVSIREVAKQAQELNATLLNELIWREFYQCILWHFPHVVSGSFRPEYDNIAWRNNEQEFELWCKGETGYPIVDAGMRQLNETGYMHNRVRMIVASFLTKHLLIDWRWGEGYFAQKLLDYDLAANNGNWQWAAGCGCDAAPYFRVFNPYTQTEKFDPEYKYIKQWVPGFDPDNYIRPIVEHTFARERCMKVYKEALVRL